MQELCELANRSPDDIKIEIEYPENNGYIRKIQEDTCYEDKKYNLCKISIEDGDCREIL